MDRDKKLALHAQPVNAVAGRVMNGGVQWEPKLKDVQGQQAWDAPPKPRGKKPQNAQDYTGLRRGRMTIGYFFESAHGKGGGAKWVARCDCGQFEIRKPLSWSLKMDFADACVGCRRKFSLFNGKDMADKSGEKEKAAAKQGSSHQPE